MSDPSILNEFKNATTVWHRDVEDIINKLLLQNAGGTDEITKYVSPLLLILEIFAPCCRHTHLPFSHSNNEFLQPTLEYVHETSPFPSYQASKQAQAAVKSFNAEYDSAVERGLEPPHPRLDERLATQIVNLRLFDINDVFTVFVGLQDIFQRDHDALQALLNELSNYATREYRSNN
jgi:hypothetical protein